MGVLTLSDVGGANPVVVPHSGLRLSWVISAAGQLSAMIPGSFARRFGLSGENATGTVWVRYESPCLPAWGGVVTMPTWTDGMLELGAEGFESLLRRRRVNRVYGQQSAPPGALAIRAIADVQADDSIGLTSMEADEYGDPVSWEWRGGDLYDDVLRQLASSSGQEWTVDADRAFQWRQQLGEDKTGTVVLTHPHHIVDYRFNADLWTVSNDVEGVASDARYERSVNAIREHTDSIRALGRRYQISKRFDRVVKGGTLVRKVWQELRANAWPAETLELTTVNVGKSWETYSLGDVITVLLPGANCVKQGRILARSIDADSATETLAVDVQNEQDGWT